jgi:hypothetical protein
MKITQETFDSVCNALMQAGYVIFPRVLTQEMINDSYWDVHNEDIIGTWSSLLEAAEFDSVIILQKINDLSVIGNIVKDHEELHK